MWSSSTTPPRTFFLLSLLITPSLAECQVRRNLEYTKKNGMPVDLITSAMFQADAVEDNNEFDMTMVTKNEMIPMDECLVFQNASDFFASEGIVVKDCNHIGWLDEGDWLAYSMPLNTTTTIYNLTLSVTSPLGDGSFRVENYDTQEIYATVENFPLTEDWNSYSSVTASLDLVNATMTNATTNITLLIRSLEAGWTFRDLCLQEAVALNNTTTVPAVPTLSPVTTPSSMPSTQPTLLVESETVTPTQAATNMAPTVVSSTTPTQVVTTIPQEEATSLSPTTASSQMPSDVPSSRPTMTLAEATTVLPTYMPSTVMPTVAHTHTYTPSLSDHPSVFYYHDEEFSGHPKKSSKKSQRYGKGSYGKGSSSTKSGKGGSRGKVSGSSGKGSLGKGNTPSGKDSSGKGYSGSGKGGIETGAGKGKGSRY